MNDTTPVRLSQLKKASRPVLLVNLVTLYRVITFPILIALVFMTRFDIFRWMLIVSFLTDAADGYLARKFKATSVLGAKLDSLGDDLTILAGLTGLVVYREDFLREQLLLVAAQLVLFLLQIAVAWLRYGKPTSFHTYLAKGAAILQGFFLCSAFLFEKPAYLLFYAASAVTLLDLLEEIGMVLVLKEWKADVKGLWWALKMRRGRDRAITR